MCSIELLFMIIFGRYDRWPVQAKVAGYFVRTDTHNDKQTTVTLRACAKSRL